MTEPATILNRYGAVIYVLSFIVGVAWLAATGAMWLAAGR